MNGEETDPRSETRRPSPSISLVICTYNRAATLADALESLLEQTADESVFEIIVVDNNSTDETRAVTLSFAERRRGVRYILEKSQGLCFARNAGFRAATSEWVMYLDDDIHAHRNLVERALHVIERYGFDCFGGLCLPWYKSGRPRWLHDRYVINSVDPNIETGILREGYAMGALVVFRKSILEELGGFAIEHSRFVGMSKDRLGYGDETVVQVRMRERGHTIGFDPELRVDHLVQESRMHPMWFLRMRFAKGRDSWDSFGIEPTVMRLLKRVPFIFLRPLMVLPGNLWRVFTVEDYYAANLFIDTLNPVARLLGEIHGGLAIMRERRKGKDTAGTAGS